MVERHGPSGSNLSSELLDPLSTGSDRLLNPLNRLQSEGAAANELKIRVTGGNGEGRTMLSAFDAALRSAGVADFNLIRLSSVIPPGSVVVESTPQNQLRGGFGDALYCVYATGWATVPGSEVWSGVAWARRRDGSGAGLFVEHSGPSEAEVRCHLTRTLDDMAIGRGGMFEYEAEVLSRVRCTGPPACALAIATYRSVGWNQ